MTWRNAVLAFALGLTGCTAPKEPSEAAADPVALVRTAVASTGTGSDELLLYGVADASPEGEHALAAQADAVLQTIAAPNGTAVRSGQLVAMLRPGPAARLDSVKAASDAAAANAALARALRLRADGLASGADVDSARAAAVSANATRSSFAERGANLALRAPVAGTVQGISARPGDVVVAGTTVATVAARGQLRGRFGIDPVLAQRVRPGQPIAISAAGAAEPLVGRVSGVDPMVDPATRLAAVYVQLPPSAAWAPGSPLRASIAVGATSRGLTIPYVALLDDGGKSYVFIVDKGVAHRRDVVPGNSQGDQVIITRGLVPGDRVVTEGATALEDGMKVRTGGAR